jgi:hypothetical protein
MIMTEHSKHRGLILATLFVGLILVAAGPALAQQSQNQQPAVEAGLNSTQTSVGGTVQYTVTVTGAAADQVPDIPHVEGLDVQRAGQQMRTEVINFNIKTKVQYTYLVTPKREGKFQIPGVDVTIGGRTFRTGAVELTVGAAGSSPAANQKLLWGEIKLGKTEAYVGESVPAEILFHFDSRIRPAGLEALPKIEASGFTFEKLTEPEQQNSTINGQNYFTIVYRTTLVPAKAGKLVIGPIEQVARVQVPIQQRPRRSPRSVDPFDPNAFDEYFESVFDSMGGLSQVQRASLKAPAVELNVKSVPVKGAPASFKGAVGKFEMKTSAEPLRMKLGDPVTLTLEITGRGAFEGFDKPVLSGNSAWRDYPPTSRFIPDGSAPNSGTKRIELVLTPSENVRNLPTAEFSYFDPEIEQFKILKSEPLPVEILGLPAPVPSPSPAPPVVSGTQTTPQVAPSPSAVAQASPSPSASVSGTTPAGDILYLTLDEPHFAPLPEPIEHTRGYLLANGALAVLVVGGAAYAFAKSRGPSAESLRRREGRAVEHAIQHLAGTTVTESEFFEQAATLMASVERKWNRLSPEVAEVCRAVVDKRNELAFGGSFSPGAGAGIDPDERATVVNALKTMRREGVL